MITQNRILRAYGTSLLGVFSGLLTNLWLLREITRHVSVADFGVYAFVLQISSYLAILQLGLDFAASRQIAESLGRNDPDAANRAYWELRRVNRISVWIAGFAVIALAATFWAGLAIARGGTSQLAAEVALLAGAAQTIGFVSRPYSAALIGSQHLSAVNVVTATRTVATSIVAYAFLTRGFGVISVPIAEILLQLSGLLVLGRMTTKHCRWRTAQPPPRDRKLLRAILRFGGVTTLGGVAWTVEGTSDVLILGWVAGPALVATYVLWWRFPQMLFDLCTRLAFSAFPGFAQRHGQSIGASRLLFGKVSVLSLGLATMALLGVSLWLPSFIHNWVGAKFAVPDSRALAFAMGLLICLRTWGNLLGMFWMATGRSALTTISSWVQAVVKVGLGLLLVRQYGMTGLVIASCVSIAIQIVLVGGALLKEQFLDRLQTLRTSLFITAAAAVALLCSRISSELSLSYLLIGAITTAAIWSGAWMIFASRSDLGPALIPAVSGLLRRLRLPWVLSSR